MIWVMAGTSDSKKIIDKLIKNRISPVITTATSLGEKNFQNYSNVYSQTMSYEDMMDFIEKKSIRLIIDATHPFAHEASSNAINAAETKNIFYIRYERKCSKANGILTFTDFESMLNELEKSKGNILLTIGVKNLDCFSLIDRERLFVKILPVKDSFCECEKHNIFEKNIIAMKGIISVKLLRSIIKEFKIRHMVMKDSGNEGGTNIKIKACKMENVKIYIIKRDVLNYTEVYTNINKLVNKVKKIKDKIS